MPGILKHKITFDYETSQLHSGAIICPSRQSGRLGLLLLALLVFWRHNGIIDIALYYPATRNFPTSFTRVRDSVIFRCMCARKRVKPNLSDGVNRGLTAFKIGKVVYKLCVNEKQISHLPVCKWLIFKWAQRGMIPRPSDYESAALTN